MAGGFGGIPARHGCGRRSRKKRAAVFRSFPSFFQGREAFALGLFAATLRGGFAPLIGPSGSGKSSGVFADLMPLLRRASGPIRTLTFSNDGRYLATGADDHTARVVEAATGRRLPGYGTTARFSP